MKALRRFGGLSAIAASSAVLVQMLEWTWRGAGIQVVNIALPLILLRLLLFFLLGLPLVILLASLCRLTVRKNDTYAFGLSFPFILLTYLVAVFAFEWWAADQVRLPLTLPQGLSLFALLGAVALLSLPARGRLFLTTIAPCVVLILIGMKIWDSRAPRWQETAKGPNVLLLVADTLRRDHTSLYGYRRLTTPNLLDLSKEATVFEQAVSTSAWTKPAMAAMLTGRYLHQDETLLEGMPTQWDGTRLPEFFYRSGYETALITANPNVGPYFRLGQGLDYAMISTPPYRFPLERFVLPRLLEQQFGLNAWLEFGNHRRLLESFQNETGIQSIEELKAFVSDRSVSAPKVASEKQDSYRTAVKEALSRYEKAGAKFTGAIPDWREPLLVPLADRLQRLVLKTSYFALAGIHADVLGRWLSDADVTDSLLTWLDSRPGKDRPFFAHLQYMGPHTPYREQVPYLLPVFDPDSPLDIESPTSQHTLPSVGAPPLPPDELYNLVANYDDDVLITDFQVGRIFQYLRDHDLMKNTIIVFTSDHGESFYEHGIFGHMFSLHWENVDVPLMIYDGRNPTGSRSSIPASILDIYPTLVRLAGLETFRAHAKDLEGISLFDSPGQPASADIHKDRLRFALTRMESNAQKEPERAESPYIGAVHRMVIRGDDKLVEEVENGISTVYLFQLSDRRERRIPAKTDDPRVVSLRKEFGPLPLFPFTFYNAWFDPRAVDVVHKH